MECVVSYAPNSRRNTLRSDLPFKLVFFELISLHSDSPQCATQYAVHNSVVIRSENAVSNGVVVVVTSNELLEFLAN